MSNVDASNLTPLEGSKRTPGNVALKRIVMEWDGLTEKFGALKNRFLAHEALTGATKNDVVAQFVECDHFMNELGNKSRLLVARIGMDGRADQAESLVWESINILQDEVDHGRQETKITREGPEKLLSSSEKQDVDVMGKNLEKLAVACKKSMGAINSMLTSVEQRLSNMLSEGGCFAQGTDRLSRGDKSTGFMQRTPVLAMEANAWAEIDVRLDKVRERVQVLEEASKVQGGTSVTFGWEHPNSNQARGISLCPSDRTASHDSILDQLEVLETRATEETCGFGGCNFSTLHDVVGFVTPLVQCVGACCR
jgi:hypothetical protein